MVLRNPKQHVVSSFTAINNLTVAALQKGRNSYSTFEKMPLETAMWQEDSMRSMRDKV